MYRSELLDNAFQRRCSSGKVIGACVMPGPLSPHLFLGAEDTGVGTLWICVMNGDFTWM